MKQMTDDQVTTMLIKYKQGDPANHEQLMDELIDTWPKLAEELLSARKNIERMYQGPIIHTMSGGIPVELTKAKTALLNIVSMGFAVALGLGTAAGIEALVRW